jgi:hypothetical protein
MNDFLAVESGIRQLQARYIDSVWRKDFDAFGDCFIEDAEWRIAGQVLRGRPACVGLLQKVMPSIERVFMMMGTPLLQLEAGEAVARTYVQEFNIGKGRAPLFAMGIYYDRCVQQGDRWRFAWHHYQSYYHGPVGLTAPMRYIIDYGAPFGMPGPDEPAPAAGTENFGQESSQ